MFGLLKNKEQGKACKTQGVETQGAGCSLIAGNLQAPLNPPVVLVLKDSERGRKR